MREIVKKHFLKLILLTLLVTVEANERIKRQVNIGFGLPQDVGGAINSFLGGFLGQQRPPQNNGRPTNPPNNIFHPFLGGFNQASCNVNNGGCSQGCRMARGRPRCFCEVGYFLDRDRTSCIDIDECTSSHNSPCQGFCTNTQGSFTCSCNPGFSLQPDGVSCGETAESRSESCGINNGGCQQECITTNRGRVRCKCTKGYSIAPDKQTCLDIDECTAREDICRGLNCVNTEGSFQCGSASITESCAINNGGCDQRCREGRRGVRCNCRRGFELQQDGATCLDIDECILGVHDCPDTCINKEGGYNCVRGDSPCAINNGGCQQRCRETRRGVRCGCRRHFTLQQDGTTCLSDSGPQPTQPPVRTDAPPPLDPCQQNNGGCQHICNNNQGSAACQCQQGFQLINGNLCEPIDPCQQSNGGCQHICNNDQGTAVCQCQQGFQLVNGNLCEPVDPCQQNNGGCQHICNNNNGVVLCNCHPGFTLINNQLCQQSIGFPVEVEVTPAPTAPPQTKGCGVNTKKSLFRRIVGGKPADPKDWPWMAALLRAEGNTQFCGGTLITDRHVLTAAHCIVQFTTSELKVRLGEYSFETPDENNPTDFRVAEIRKHEKYNANNQENDIAILKLGRPSTFSEFIWPACLPPPDNDLEDQLGYVTGWGTIHFGGPVSQVLQEVVIPVWKQDDCKGAYPENLVTDSMMCAGNKAGGKDSCQGDSGGPFLVQIFPETRWYVAGVVSWGIECASPNRPGVYTRVNKYLDWIKDNSVF